MEGKASMMLKREERWEPDLTNIWALIIILILILIILK